MTLKELMEVMPGYITVHVHGNSGKFAHKGNPFAFIDGVYKKYSDCTIITAIPLETYMIEVIVLEEVT